MKAALTLRNDIAELPRLLAFACDFAGECGIPADEISRLLVILDEVFSNIVRHGYDGAGLDGIIAAGTIVVHLSFADRRLGIEVSDDARPFDPLAAAEPDLDTPASQRPLGGLGIHLVRSLADEARYARRGRYNRLVLFRRIPPSRAG